MSQPPVYPRGDSTWWTHDRFGMFIHWGIYSIPARGEWVRTWEKMPQEQYDIYREHFHPDRFDPAAWARLARDAGMKYVVFTAKHHDGFCMWDSKFTDYKADRDYVREILDAFRKEGLRAGLYYSLLDWHHPDFVVDDHHPLRDLGYVEPNRGRDQHRYCQYMRDQVTELLTEYGPIDIMWFDFTYPSPDGKRAEDWEAEELLALVRRLRPGILIDDRLGLPGAGDFRSPEQYVPRVGLRDEAGNPILWEGCQTFSGSWGYHRDETTWKTTHQLVSMLIQHVARGGNLLLNVGPDPRGRIDRRAQEALQGIAQWMDEHSASIYGCTAAPAEWAEPDNCLYTWHPGNRKLYLHILEYPVKYLFLPGLADKVKFARFLNDGSEVRFMATPAPQSIMASLLPPGTLGLSLPPVPPPVTVPVIELTL